MTGFYGAAPAINLNKGLWLGQRIEPLPRTAINGPGVSGSGGSALPIAWLGVQRCGGEGRARGVSLLLSLQGRPRGWGGLGGTSLRSSFPSFLQAPSHLPSSPRPPIRPLTAAFQPLSRLHRRPGTRPKSLQGRSATQGLTSWCRSLSFRGIRQLFPLVPRRPIHGSFHPWVPLFWPM